MAENDIAARLETIREQIARACTRAGRHPSQVTLVAASKSRTVAEVEEASRLGLTDFGENYWQDARSKVTALPHLRWHFIGRLQENKAKYVARHFHVLQSLDTDATAATLSKKLIDVDRTCQVLVEVNIDSERTKGGVGPEAVSAFVERVSSLPRLDVIGLMTMGAPGADERTLRLRFVQMRELFERLPMEMRRELSMGMSDDFSVAIEEGATMIRIGTAIFGPRPPV